jgi:polar amino acid transport system substrate-binding protein
MHQPPPQLKRLQVPDSVAKMRQGEEQMRRCVYSLATFVIASVVATSISAAELVPTGTLRASFIDTNPVQGQVNPTTGGTYGIGPDLAREPARRLGVPARVSAAPGVAGVLNSVKNGDADIGFLAFDPARAVEVDYSAPYSLGQNTFIVLETSPIKSVTEVDRAGIVLGATQGDAGELYLSRTLKNAKVDRNRGGDMDLALKMLKSGEIAAYGTNRQRLADLAAKAPGLRLLPDNFYGVEQCIIVRKGNTALLQVVQKFLDEARASGFTAAAIERAGIAGVELAPPRSQPSR